MTKATRTLLVLAISSALPSARAAQDTFTATVSFQQGVNGYGGASDDSLRPGRIKLVDDRKRTLDWWHEKQIKLGKLTRETVLEGLSNYRHVLRWDGLNRWIRGENVTVRSATVRIFYTDEFWSFYDYEVALHRSLDGTKDNTRDAAAAVAHILGERRGRGAATPFRSWIELTLRPQLIQAWIDDPKHNQGLVLLQHAKTDPPGKKSTGGFVVFASNTNATAGLRPTLTITYEASGNVPPFAPVLTQRFDGITLGNGHVVRWTVPEPPDLNRDAIRFELSCASADGAWQTVAKDIPGDQRQFAWNTTAVPAGRGYRLRLRAVDRHGAASEWTASTGRFSLVHRPVPFQIGIETPLRKVRRAKPYGGPLAREASIELARNEREGFQIVVAGVHRGVKGLRVTPSDLASPKGILAAKHVTVNPVGYVNTIAPSYSPQWVGQWPDPLLNVDEVDVPAGKNQPVWVTVYAPAGTPAGTYSGTLTITADDTPPRKVALRVRVFDFDLPVRPTLRTFALGNIAGPKFYGLEPGPEYDEIRRRWYGLLCSHRLSPGGFVLKAWGWDKPSYPAKAHADGSFDFSEAERWGQYCFERGMNAFVAALFTKPGKWGFPQQYSEKYYRDYARFMTAYATFLRHKGWLKDAVVYNIDEAPAKHWNMCKENYRRTKAISRDLQVFQCLNDPKGVQALTGFFDVVDVNIGQFHRGAAPQRLQEGGRVWWCVCCWPAGHPNLFVDYPAIDPRIIGWLSWKLAIEGFEYWSVSSWSRCLKAMGGKKFVDRVDSTWNANSFGKYNGDGYLVYPGPGNTLLSSIRLEALRDGFEDHEYLAILRRRLEGSTGRAEDEARKLLDVSDALCTRGLRYTADPRVLLATRRRIALAIETLGR